MAVPGTIIGVTSGQASTQTGATAVTRVVDQLLVDLTVPGGSPDNLNYSSRYSGFGSSYPYFVGHYEISNVEVKLGATVLTPGGQTGDYSYNSAAGTVRFYDTGRVITGTVDITISYDWRAVDVLVPSGAFGPIQTTGMTAEVWTKYSCGHTNLRNVVVRQAGVTLTYGGMGNDYAFNAVTGEFWFWVGGLNTQSCFLGGPEIVVTHDGPPSTVVPDPDPYFTIDLPPPEPGAEERYDWFVVFIVADADVSPTFSSLLTNELWSHVAWGNAGPGSTDARLTMMTVKDRTQDASYPHLNTPTVRATFNSAQSAAWTVFRIAGDGWGPSRGLLYEVLSSEGTGTAPDTGAKTVAGGTYDKTWFAVHAWEGDSLYTSYPLNHADNFVTQKVGALCGIAASTVTNDENTWNPDPGTLGSSVPWYAMTVGMWLPTEGPPPERPDDPDPPIDPATTAAYVALLEGFEHDVGLWSNRDTWIGTDLRLTSEARRSGVRGLRMLGGDGWGGWDIYRPIPHGKEALHMTVGWAMRSKGPPDSALNLGGKQLVGLYDETGALAANVSISWNFAHPNYLPTDNIYRLHVTAGRVTTSAGIPTKFYHNTLYANEDPWNYYELRVDRSSYGEVELRVNGRVLFKAGGDTWYGAGGSGKIKFVRLGSVWQSVDVDDVYVLACGDDAQFLGPISVLGAMPLETSQNEWQGWHLVDNARTELDPSCLAVDETFSDHHESYIAGSAELQTELFRYWEAPHEVVAPIYGLSLSGKADKTEAIDCALRFVTLVDATEQVSDAFYPSYKSWFGTDATWTTNPAGAQWTWQQARVGEYGVRVDLLEA